MNMSSTGSQLAFEDNDVFNLNSDYIEDSTLENKINIAQLYNEKETFQNNFEKFQTKIKLLNINSDRHISIKKYDPTKNSLEKTQFYYFIIYFFFFGFVFFFFMFLVFFKLNFVIFNRSTNFLSILNNVF